MCLNIGTPIFFNFPFPNGKSMVLAVPVLKHIRVHHNALFPFSKGLNFWFQHWLACEKIPIPKGLLLKKIISSLRMGGKMLTSNACIGSE